MNQSFVARWKKVSLPNKLTVMCTAVIAIATVLYVCASFRQLSKMEATLTEMRTDRQGSTDQANQVIGNMNWLARTMENSLRESNKQSREALEASIVAARNDQRAWIGVTRIDGTLESTAHRLEIRIANSGKSPARDVHAFHASACGPLGKLPPFGEKESDAVGHTALAPAAEMILVRNKFCDENVEDIKSAIEGRSSLYIYGTIWYKDAFGTHRKTTFCDVWNSNSRTMDACKEHNNIE